MDGPQTSEMVNDSNYTHSAVEQNACPNASSFMFCDLSSSLTLENFYSESHS